MNRDKTMGKNGYQNIRNKIFASMILAPAIPFLLIIGIEYYYYMSSMQEKTNSMISRIVSDHRHMIQSFLNERITDLQFITDTYSYDTIIEPNVLKKAYESIEKKTSAFIDLGVFDQYGLHVAYYGPYELKGKIYRDTEWFNTVLQNGVYISDVFLGYRKVPHFIVAVLKTEADRIWILRATINSSLFSNVVESIRIGKTGEAYIMNKEGRFQTKRRSGGNLMDADPEWDASFSFHQGVRTFVREDLKGDEYLYATTWLNDGEWILVARQETAEAFASLRHTTYLVIALAVICGGMIVLAAFLLSNRIISRMKFKDTEKEEVDKQLIVAGRLAEIGEMSAGVAHEINNPLQIMKAEQTLIETILDDMRANGSLKESEELKELEDSLNQINKQIGRCGEITQGLLKFARQKDSNIQDLDLREYLPETIRLLERKATVEGITIEQRIDTDTPPVRADAAQLQQVLVNLLNNAIYAINDRDDSQGGSIVVETAKSANGEVRISVKDNGSGISPENLRKIFTPFFTTKPVGKGTGLGLSICYGIIEKMGGVMEVESAKGLGATFTIRLKASS